MRPTSPRNYTNRPELPREFYYKAFTCPATGAEFKTPVVKANAYTVRGRDPDFCPRYDGINPLHYAVIVSPTGFAAEEAIYKRSPRLLFRDLKALKEHMRNQPDLPDFSSLRDIGTACRSYEIALGLTGFLRMPRYQIAGLALRGSWVYREWYEEGHEPAARQAMVLRNIALEHYLQAYEKEDTTKLKIGSAGVGYLIAELLREQARFDESLRWFTRVVTDKSAGSEVKRNARNQMDLCRDQRKQAKESGTYVKPEMERAQERCVYQIYRDQARWLSRLAESGSLSESAILRSLLDALKEAELDFTAFDKEEKLQQWLVKRLREGM